MMTRLMTPTREVFTPKKIFVENQSDQIESDHFDMIFNVRAASPRRNQRSQLRARALMTLAEIREDKRDNSTSSEEYIFLLQSWKLVP
jgi:hypothetical protein